MAANIFLNNSSLDITVSQVDFNGVTATYVGGPSYPPNNPGDNTNLETTEIGVYTLLITYGSSISGQHIYVTDSDLAEACQDTGSPPGGVMTFTNIKYNGVNPIFIEPRDGSCASLPTPTPTPPITPFTTPTPTETVALTPTPTETPASTPGSTPVSTPTPTETPSSTPTPTPISCYFYTNTSGVNWNGDWQDCDGTFH